MTTTFSEPENMFQVKCDVHPWMRAYIGVFSHPFFSVTGTDGKFTIPGLGAGTYEITAWHERLGTQTASITVAANETKTQDFTFAVPATRHRSTTRWRSKSGAPGLTEPGRPSLNGVDATTLTPEITQSRPLLPGRRLSY